jgi:hypothetical protein
MREPKKCVICSEPVRNARYDYCSSDCKRKYNSQRWQEPLSDDQYNLMLACVKQMPEKVQVLFKDRMTVQKFAIELKAGRVPVAF